MKNQDKTMSFIQRANLIHNNKYDYSKVDYVNSYTKVCIICPKHGEFWQQPRKHLAGQGCTKCKNLYHYSSDEYITKVNNIHNGKYDYSKTKYINSKSLINVICPEHGEFSIRADHHLIGEGCKKCADIEKSKGNITFINESRIIHKDKYNYSKVNYINCYTPVCIICPEHGEFWQTPQKHLLGCGCQSCQNSILENNVYKLLKDNNINFNQQVSFDWLRYDKPLRLDFYLPEYNVAIECQGIQHFEPIDYFGGKSYFELCKIRDELKYNLCKEHNIKLLYYTNIDAGDYIHKTITNLEELLKNIKKMD